VIARRRDERGDTLVELLITVAVLGIAGVALLGMIASGVFSSGLHRQQTNAQSVLVSAGEAIVDQVRNPYNLACTTPSYGVSGVTLPTGWIAGVVTVGTVQYWNGTTFQSTCYDNQADGFLHLQLVPITVKSPDGSTVVTRSFVKRAP
jgi:type II secretory pathway pseudopilin PulG